MDQPIVIFDWESNFISRRWAYTALTRGTSLVNTYIYSGTPEERAALGITEAGWQRVCASKVQGYKQQETLAGRAVGDVTAGAFWNAAGGGLQVHALWKDAGRGGRQRCNARPYL